MQFTNISGLSHSITTRQNGFSSGPYASRNLGLHVGDDAAIVQQNRQVLAQEHGFDIKKLVCAQQIHGKNIGIISRETAGRGALDWESALPESDALITDEVGIPLLILVADCAPILLFEPNRRVFAVVHAGWRGAVAGIAGETVELMKQRFGCEAGAIQAGIGPCLSQENLEVGREVAEMIPQKSVLKPHGEKWLLDLRGLIALDLKAAAIQSENIEISNFCTKARPDLFFSHRGQNGVAGRFGILYSRFKFGRIGETLQILNAGFKGRVFVNGAAQFVLSRNFFTRHTNMTFLINPTCDIGTRHSKGLHIGVVSGLLFDDGRE
jgi:YfiH family protein